MATGKERMVLGLLLVCSWPAFGGLVECRWDAISMDQIGSMQMDGIVPDNGYSYSFVNGARDIGDGSDFGAVRNAFQTWIDEPSSALWAAERASQRSFTPGQMNSQNDISWIGPTATEADPWSHVLGLSDRTIAVVLTWYHGATRRVVERDLYFNDVDMHWRTNSDGLEEGGFFVEHIALHEIGHVFGLRDVYNPGQEGWEEWMGSGNQTLAMYGYSSWLNEDVTLHEADIAAITMLHPSSSSVPEAGTLPLFGLAAGIFLVTRKR